LGVPLVQNDVTMHPVLAKSLGTKSLSCEESYSRTDERSRMVVDRLSVLMLSWEFPPRVIGGISSHVSDLSVALARKGLSLHVVTCDFPGAPDYEEMNGVHVYRFDSYKPSAPGFLSWVFSMNQDMAQRAMEAIDSHHGRVDVIHAHDWLVANAAIGLRDQYGASLVSTVHSTEAGRRGGIQNDYQRTINEVERNLINQSSGVICCSNYMAGQISNAFGVPREKLHVIRNGVNVSRFDIKIDVPFVRRRYAEPNEKIVLYVGRLVHEKGVHVLIGAAHEVLGVIPNVKFIIVGEGGAREYLLREASYFGVADRVLFMGFVEEKTLTSIYRVSDVAVVPSLYEPFGITALEAMAAKVPLVASDTGGLTEIVEHDKTGVKVYPDNSDSLAWGILRVLGDQAYAETIRENAYQKVVKVFDWNTIADETIAEYRHATMPRAPGSARMLDLQVPVPRWDRYPDEFRLLLLLYTLGAVSSERTRSASELSVPLGVEVNVVRRLLRKLVEAGYTTISRDSSGRVTWYLTRSGILRACSQFS